MKKNNIKIINDELKRIFNWNMILSILIVLIFVMFITHSLKINTLEKRIIKLEPQCKNTTITELINLNRYNFFKELIFDSTTKYNFLCDHNITSKKYNYNGKTHIGLVLDFGKYNNGTCLIKYTYKSCE